MMWDVRKQETGTHDSKEDAKQTTREGAGRYVTVTCDIGILKNVQML